MNEPLCKAPNGTLCSAILKFWFQSRLFAQLVCSYAVKCLMTLYGNCFCFVRVNRMIASFSKQIEAVFFKILNNVPPFNGHCQSQPLPARIDRLRQAIPALSVGMQVSFHEARLSTIDDNLQKFFLLSRLRAIQLIVPCNPIESLCTWQCSSLTFFLPILHKQNYVNDVPKSRAEGSVSRGVRFAPCAMTLKRKSPC